MKLKNPIIITELRTFYLKNNWKHDEVQKYLADHHSISVCIRTLKYWKKCLSNNSWQGPIVPKPPTPPVKATQEQILRICKLRKKTGWGALPLKHIFNFEVSESTYKALSELMGFHEVVKSKIKEFIG